MPVVVAPGLALLSLIQPEMEVTWNQGGVYYAGCIRAITPRDEWRADYIELDIECQDYTTLLDDNVCSLSVPGPNPLRAIPETDGQRIRWLLQNYDTHGITAYHVQDLVATMPVIDYSGLTVSQAIASICKLSGASFYVDSSKDLHTFTVETNQAPFALSDSPDGITTFGYGQFTYPQDSVTLKNAVYYIPKPGGSALPTWYVDNVSVTTYGRREASVKDESIQSQGALDAAGTAFLSANKNPLRHASCLVFRPGLQAGMTVALTNTLYGIAAQNFVIQSVDTTYPDDQTPFFAIQFADEVVTFATQVQATSSSIANVQGGAGFAVQSVFDLINMVHAGGLLNANWRQGSTYPIAVSEAAGGATLDAYAASQSPSLPYWVVSQADGILKVGNTTSGGLPDSTNPWALLMIPTSPNQTFRIYQDVPFFRAGINNADWRLLGTWEINGNLGGSQGGVMNVYCSWRTTSHSLVLNKNRTLVSSQPVTDGNFLVSLPLIPTGSVGVPDVAYLRVEIEWTGNTSLLEVALQPLIMAPQNPGVPQLLVRKSGTAATYDFTSIPQTYKELEFRFAWRSSDAVGALETMTFRFNGDSTANYYNQKVQGTGATASSVETLAATGFNQLDIPGGGTGQGVTVGHIQIPNYPAVGSQGFVASTLSWVGTGTGNMRVGNYGGFWNSSAAVTQVTFIPPIGFWSGSYVELWGIP